VIAFKDLHDQLPMPIALLADFRIRPRHAVHTVAAAFLAVALVSTGCSSSGSSTPTTPSPADAKITEVFNGTLPVNGSRMYSVSIASYGTITATLTSMGGSGVPPSVVVNLGVGFPAGASCNATAVAVQVTGTADLTTQASTTQQPGTYCVIISDVGNLFAPATFSISITHP
jgi:hypothetical protein